MERFGATEVEEALKSSAEASKTIAARRKSKMARKLNKKMRGNSVS